MDFDFGNVVRFLFAATVLLSDMITEWVVKFFSRYIFPCLVAYLVLLGFLAIFKGVKSFVYALGVTVGACLMLYVAELPTLLLWWPIILRDFLGWELLRIVLPNPRPEHFIWYVCSTTAVVVLQVLVPFKILSWLLDREIIRSWLESWWWWVKVLYTYMTAHWIALFAARQTQETFFGAIWAGTFLWCLWCFPAAIFYCKLVADEKARVAPPRWVGNDTTIRHSFWLGWISTILKMGGWVFDWGNSQPTTPDTSLGAGREGTISDAEKAGLL